MGKVQRKLTKLKITSTGNGRKKRWAKGHSSDSNPSTRIHRDAATNRFYHPEDKNKDLRLRDMKMLEKMDLNLDDRHSEGGLTADSDADTVATRLSSITNCTNPTFDKVHRIWKSGSKLHTDILAVLASVTDAIKSKGGTENELEYFAALLNPLTDPDSSDNIVAATSYLLSLVIRKVPKSILIQQFDRVSEIIYAAVRKACDSPDDATNKTDEHDSSILRYLASCLGYLLEIRPRQFWTVSPHDLSMTKMLDRLLEFTVYEKPRVRKSAQKAIVQLMSNHSSMPAVVSRRCADFCVQQMERFSGGGKGKRDHRDSTLHALNLLQFSLHRFAVADLKRIVETVFKVLALSDYLTTAVALRCLYNTFRNRPTKETLPADLNAKIILAIYDFQPTSKDSHIRAEWMLLITEAHASLLDHDVDLLAQYVHRLVDSLVQHLTGAEHADALSTAVDCLKKIYGDFAASLAKSESTKAAPALEQCLDALTKLLSPQYYVVWPHVFGLFATCFESIGDNPAIVGELKNYKTSLKLITELRENESFPCKLPAEKAIGAAIRHQGAEEVLAIIPLRLNPDTPSQQVLDFPRSWLLPLLRTKLGAAKIGFFASYFLPLAIKIDQRVKDIQAHGRDNVEAKVLEAVEKQIWELFPAFCKNPTDLVDSFPTVARALGAALLGRPKLRLSILGGLRRLLQNDGASIVMEKYGKNYLNVLLQLYTSKTDREQTADYDDAGVRLAILDTIRSLLAVGPRSDVIKYLEAVAERLKSCDVDHSADSAKKCQLMDILLALIPHLESEERRYVYELIVETMATAEKRTEKKCWRVLEELCSGSGEAARSFVLAHLSNLRDHLRTELTSSAPATKACRLRCSILVLDQLKDASDLDRDESFVLSTIPDAVNCLYGSSGKARKVAAKLLVKAASLLAGWKKDVDSALLLIFGQLPSLDGDEGRKVSTEDLSSAVYSSRLLCYEFRNDISADLISSILGRVCRLLSDDSRRPVSQSCVEFLKTFVGCFPEFTVGQFLETVVSALCNQNEDCLRHCRSLVRKVMAKLVKRFSYVTVRKFVPESYEKQLNNIRKLVARAEKRKTQSDDGAVRKGAASTVSSIGDGTSTIFTAFTNLSRPETIADLLEDTSDEESEDDDRRKPTKRKAPPVWLMEGDEEEVVDLLDKKKCCVRFRGNDN